MGTDGINYDRITERSMSFIHIRLGKQFYSSLDAIESVKFYKSLYSHFLALMKAMKTLATTRIIAMHRSAGCSLAQSLFESNLPRVIK